MTWSERGERELEVTPAEECVRNVAAGLRGAAVALFELDEEGRAHLRARAGAEPGPDWRAVGALWEDEGEAPFAGLDPWVVRPLRAGHETLGLLALHLGPQTQRVDAAQAADAVVPALSVELAASRLERCRLELAVRAAKLHAVWCRMDEAPDPKSLLHRMVEGACTLWPLDGAAAEWLGEDAGPPVIHSPRLRAGAHPASNAQKPGGPLGPGAERPGPQHWRESDLLAEGAPSRVRLMQVPLHWGDTQVGRLYLWRRQSAGPGFHDVEREAAAALGDAAVRRLLDLRAERQLPEHDSLGQRRLHGMVQALCLWTRLVERAPDPVQRGRRADAAVRLLRKLDRSLSQQLGAAG